MKLRRVILTRFDFLPQDGTMVTREREPETLKVLIFEVSMVSFMPLAMGHPKIRKWMGSRTTLRCFVLIDIREYQDSSMTTSEYIFIAMTT
jgi:hypothetical protein